MATVRTPAVAGMFYPAEPQLLQQGIHALLDEVKAAPVRPKALIAPHAGYIYSGPIAASAYALLAPLRETITRVVLLGPVHRVWVKGLALPMAESFETPLGVIPLDTATIRQLKSLPQVEVSAPAHAWEHSLEVHLPFLQVVLGSFTLVPLAVGGAEPREVAQVLELIWGGDETLIVVSSDLSHYLPYAEACTADTRTVQTILELRPELESDQACGSHPINGLVLAARKKGLQPHLLDLRNSGDTAGEKDRVVGYAAFAFSEANHGH